MTKTRTKTSTTTGVALATVGFAVVAAAALAFNFNDMNGLTAPRPQPPAATIPAGTDTGSRVGGTIATGDRGIAMAPVITPATPAAPFTQSACRANVSLVADLTLGADARVAPAYTGMTKHTLWVPVVNNGAKAAGPFLLKCIQKDPSGNWTAIAPITVANAEANRQMTQNVDFNLNATHVECFVDAEDRITESNECNNVKRWNVESPF